MWWLWQFWIKHLLNLLHHRHRHTRGTQASLPWHKNSFQRLLDYNPSWSLKIEKNIWCYSKKSITYSAHETIWMELTVESADVIFHNRSIASRTFGSKHIEVIFTAIRLTVLFMKTIISKLLTTLNTEEVFGVPCFVHSCHAFLMKEIKT